MIELLSPAGDYESGVTALISGADAIYCATERFGARAYAKNLSFKELTKLLVIAHSLKKKVYITVNTMIKEEELFDCYRYLDSLYELGVDGVIVSDFAVISYVIKHLPLMEAHISTQAGVKELKDVLFFEDIKAHRVVLARETSIEEIAEIKRNSSIDLEIFSHGALCVSYSGGCLLSSYLTLRSGNRGRCSQNCRRSYSLYKGKEQLASSVYLLSMKDLNTASSLSFLKKINIASLKLEGRMKNKDYVKIVTKEYRKALDEESYLPRELDKIFHRSYTKGFIFNEDKENIVDIKRKGNEGEWIGQILFRENKLTLCEFKGYVSVGDRIRIEADEDYYFTIDTLYNLNKTSIEQGQGKLYLNIFKGFSKNTSIYKMVDTTKNSTLDKSFKKAITITASGEVNKPLTLSTIYNGTEFSASSKELLQNAQNKPLNTAILAVQLSKTNETLFYVENVLNELKGSLFLTIASINEARRLLIQKIDESIQQKRMLPPYQEKKIIIPYLKTTPLVAYCFSEEQYRACLDENIDEIYYQNHSPYVNAKYQEIKEDYVLVSGYGGLRHYKDKKRITDYSFNVMNSASVYELEQMGASYVTLSLEASLNDIKAIYQGYVKNYIEKPNLEMVIYGKATLMTMKYCPLKRYKQCGDCKKGNYFLRDDKTFFPLLQKDCITYLLNARPLNLMDQIPELSKYVSRFRIQFTTEDYQEARSIIQRFKDSSNTKKFNSSLETRGYYKRNIF